MKQIITTLLVVFSLSFLRAQTNYEKGMQKAFGLWQNNDRMEASNLFERIANAEKDQWLPYYYAAHINIVNSFGEKDEQKLSAQLGKAQNLLNEATAISEDNPEIMVLQALLHTAWVAFDGATYGMTLGPKVAGLYERAEALAPNNPRVVYCKAEWNMGSARYFGQDIAPYCKDLERALELFANFKPESEFHPKWGKERTESILEACKN